MPTINILTLQEVKQELGISRATVYRLIDAGDLDRVHVRASVRFTRKSVDAYLSRQLQFEAAGRTR